MIGQRLQIALSFLLILIAYGMHGCTKPSEMAMRGLDPKLFKIREFRVEKQWGCKYCGYLKNVASSPLCLQCGTSQLGGNTILPSATTRGTASEAWAVRTRVDVTTDEVQGSEGKRVVSWEREHWPFRSESGGGGGRGGHTEVPSALALAEHGFIAGENTGVLSRQATVNKGKSRVGPAKWGTVRHPTVPPLDEMQGAHLEWMSSVAGVPIPENVSTELLTDLTQARNSFYPEKVAWFYDQLQRLKVEVMMEDVPTEFATAYPNSVLRDSLAILTKVTPLQVLKGHYHIQFVASRSHTRVSSMQTGDLKQSWLRALFKQFTDPACGILQPCDDYANAEGSHIGSLELLGSQPPSGQAKSHIGSSHLKILNAGANPNELDENDVPHDVLSFYHALGRAMAMAVVSRTFVRAPLSPALCKLLLGRPCHFLDLLTSKQALFQDLLKLAMLPSDAVERLQLRMPDSTMPPPAATRRDTHHAASASRATTREDWAGRGAKQGDKVDVGNRAEYVYRKVEHQLFGRCKPQLSALRRGLFEVIPQELFAVFDHSEFLMLLNGHHRTDEDTTTSAKVFV